MEIILKETKKIIITLFIIDILFLIASLIFGFFNMSVIYGILFGFFYTVVNFMLLGQIVSRAIVKQPRSAKSYIQLHYAFRFLIAAFVLAIAFISPYINPWIVVLSMFAPKFTYYTKSIYECFNGRGKKVGFKRNRS